MIANIWKLSKIGWHIFLNGTGEQQLAAGLAIGAIVGIEKAIIVVSKTKRKTKELEKKYQQIVKENDKLEKQAREDISEMERIIEETEEYTKVKRELEEMKKNDPMKKEMERLIRQADRLLSED